MKNKQIKLAIAFLGIITIGLLGNYFLYLYKQNKVNIIPEKDFYIETEEKNNIDYIAETWVMQYISQFQQPYIEQDRKIEEFQIEKVEILDTALSIVQVDFTVKTAKKHASYFLDRAWGTEAGENILKCQWVITLEKKDINRMRQLIYQVAYRQTPVEYQITHSYEEEVAPLNTVSEQEKHKQCTYKIEEGNLYLTYDYSKTWKKVEEGGKLLKSSNDGLEEGLYQITKEVTILANSTGTILYSIDQGNTWKTLKFTNQPNIGIMYIHFINPMKGYVVNIEGTALGGVRMFAIYATQNAGETWEASLNPFQAEDGFSTIHEGADFNFLNEAVGFITSPNNGGESSTLYKTEDGYKTFHEVSIPEQNLEDSHLNWNEIYDTPGVPYEINGELWLVVGQGTDGDYQGNNVVFYKSSDMGNTWEFVKN